MRLHFDFKDKDEIIKTCAVVSKNLLALYEKTEDTNEKTLLSILMEEVDEFLYQMEEEYDANDKY